MKFDCLKASLRLHEAVVPHMYRDSKGIVTCGVGHALRTVEAAQKLPWLDSDGDAWEPDGIAREYEYVKTLGSGMAVGYYRTRTALHLTPEFIETQLDADVREKVAEIVALYPEFTALPECVQEALLDIAFNCGVAGKTGLLYGFPKLMAHVRAGEWAEAALESRRPEVGEERNKMTADLLLEAARPVGVAT